MSRQIQIRRGTATEHKEFIGAIGEITMDTDAKTLRIHDGETPGGFALAHVNNNTADSPGSELPKDSDFVIETKNTASGWYRKYKSGWIEQGGEYTGVPTGNGGAKITFPQKMADNSYIANAIGYSASAAYAYGTKDLAINGMTIMHNATGGAVNMKLEIKGMGA